VFKTLNVLPVTHIYNGNCALNKIKHR